MFTVRINLFDFLLILNMLAQVYALIFDVLFTPGGSGVFFFCFGLLTDEHLA